jgi:hypothetical protein
MKIFSKIVFCLFLLHLSLPAEEAPGIRDPGTPVVLTLQVKNVTTTELRAYIIDNIPYLPLVDLFTQLRIRVAFDSASGAFTGYFITKDSSYRFDMKRNLFTINKRQHELRDSDYVYANRELYLRLGVYKLFFNLNFSFSPLALSVKLKPARDDLPIYKMQRIQRQISSSTGETQPTFSADKYFPIERSFFSAGVLEWNLRYHYLQDVGSTELFNYAAGMEALWGDLNISGRMASNKKLAKDDYRGTLAYDIIGNPLFGQIIIGDITPPLTLFSPALFGVSVTNRPRAYPIKFAEDEEYSDVFGKDRSILLSERSKLYYLGKTGDEESFRHHIPLYFGLNTIHLRAVDFWGDEIQKDYLYNIPTSLLRAGDLQYGLYAGSSRIRTGSPFYGMGNLQWGVNSDVTVGWMMESYKSSDLSTRKYYPTMFFSSRLSKGFLFNGSVSPDLASQATVDWTFPTLANVRAGVVSYLPGSPVNFRNINTEYDFSAIIPISGKDYGTSLVTSFQHLNLQSTVERSFQSILSARIGVVQPSIGYFASWAGAPGDLSIITSNSQYAFSVQLPQSIVLQNQLSYNHIDNKFFEYDLFAGRNIGQGFVTITYRTTFSNYSYLTAGFRYYFPFLQSRTVYSRSDTKAAFDQNLTGAILFSTITRDFLFDRNQNRTRSGNLLVDIFEDANNNGKRDAGERFLPISSLGISSDYGGASARQRGNNTYDIRSMIPYGEYHISLNRLNLDDPLLVPAYSNFSVVARSGDFHLVEIPLIVGGTVRGLVLEKIAAIRVPVEGLVVQLEPTDSTARNRKMTTRTFSTGEFEFTHIIPGNYRVLVSPDDLAKSGMTSSSAHLISVQQKPEGDILENINFEVLRAGGK